MGKSRQNEPPPDWVLNLRHLALNVNTLNVNTLINVNTHVLTIIIWWEAPTVYCEVEFTGVIWMLVLLNCSTGVLMLSHGTVDRLFQCETKRHSDSNIHITHTILVIHYMKCIIITVSKNRNFDLKNQYFVINYIQIIIWPGQPLTLWMFSHKNIHCVYCIRVNTFVIYVYIHKINNWDKHTSYKCQRAQSTTVQSLDRWSRPSRIMQRFSIRPHTMISRNRSIR